MYTKPDVPATHFPNARCPTPSPETPPPARGPQVARADPRSQLPRTPPSSGLPAAPRAPTPRHASPHSPAQRRPHAVPIRPQMIRTARPFLLIPRTHDWRPVNREVSEDAPHFTTLPPPRRGNPPLAPGDCPSDLLPMHAPFARRSQVACATSMRHPDGTASADSRSQLPTTPTNTDPPAAPPAHTPAPRLTPQSGPTPPR